MVPKLLLQASIVELHKNIVSDTIEGRLKETRDEDDNIIISDYTLRSILPPQYKNSSRYKFRCGCECFLYEKCIHSSLILWRDRYLRKLKDHSQNSQNRRSEGK